MTLGLKTTRELCLRCPHIMTEELLRDLAEYKKFRNKEVASAARGMIGLFRSAWRASRPAPPALPRLLVQGLVAAHLTCRRPVSATSKPRRVRLSPEEACVC